MRLAAAGHGLLLVVDDVHEADEASLRLLHYLARCAVTEPVLIALAAPARRRPALREVGDSLVARGIGDGASSWRRWTRPPPGGCSPTASPTSTTQTRGRDLGGVRRAAVPGPGGRARRPGRQRATSPCPAWRPGDLRDLRRVALLGSAFSTDELLAVSGRRRGPRPTAAWRPRWRPRSWSRPSPATGSGTRWSATRCWRRTRRTSGPARAGRWPSGWPTLGAPPARVAHLFIASGHPVQAVPYARPAVETAGALGAYRDGLALVDAVVDHATGEDRAHLLARRGDLLTGAGRPGRGRGLPGRHARRPPGPSTGWSGPGWPAPRASRATSRPLRPPSPGSSSRATRRTAPMLLAPGQPRLLHGRRRRRLGRRERGHGRCCVPDDPWQIVDLVSLQGLIAHQRGEWFERFGRELRQHPGEPRAGRHRLRRAPVRGGVPPLRPDPVRRGDRAGRAAAASGRAVRRAARRGLRHVPSSARPLLLKGDLDAAERELEEAVDLHHDVDASAGEAHSLQRLAEVRLASGDRAGAPYASCSRRCRWPGGR